MTSTSHPLFRSSRDTETDPNRDEFRSTMRMLSWLSAYEQRLWRRTHYIFFLNLEYQPTISLTVDVLCVLPRQWYKEQHRDLSELVSIQTELRVEGRNCFKQNPFLPTIELQIDKWDRTPTSNVHRVPQHHRMTLSNDVHLYFRYGDTPHGVSAHGVAVRPYHSSNSR